MKCVLLGMGVSSLIGFDVMVDGFRRLRIRLWRDGVGGLVGRG